jgi:hypothetical protein
MKLPIMLFTAPPASSRFLDIPTTLTAVEQEFTKC